MILAQENGRWGMGEQKGVQRDKNESERQFRHARLRRGKSNGERTRNVCEPRSRYVEGKGVMGSRTRGVETFVNYTSMSVPMGALVEVSTKWRQ